ncbi:MAG: AI-2E family transporter [bacterium]|nr:AI-2E family transporter [bacterium]
MNLRILNVTNSLLVLALFVFTLYIGQALILPFVVAIIVSYFFVNVTNFFEGIPLGRWRIPRKLAVLLSLAVTFLLFEMGVGFLIDSASGVINEAPVYQAKLLEMAQKVDVVFGEEQVYLNEFISGVNLNRIITSAAASVSNLLRYFSLVIVYVLFILLEYKSINTKLQAMSKNEEQYARWDAIVTRIISDINTYMKIKTFVSALTGLLSFLILTFFGVNFAALWSVIIFLLNFIPTIGSILAVVMSLVVVLVQFGSFSYLLTVGLLLTAVQLGIGNILDPRLMGRSLNLSPLVLLLALAFWGAIWGVLGMFLCVPFMVIINIILSHFPQTRKIAIVLSEDGNIQ